MIQRRETRARTRAPARRLAAGLLALCSALGIPFGCDAARSDVGEMQLVVDVALTGDDADPCGVRMRHVDRLGAQMHELNLRTEVRVERTSDSELRLVSAKHGTWSAGITAQLTIWLRLHEGEIAGARASARTLEDPGSASWQMREPTGVVRVSSRRLPESGDSNPLVVAYELTGDLSGSPVTWSGKLALRASDLR